MAVEVGKSIQTAVEEAATEKMNEIASFIFTRSQENLIKNGSVDRGLLLASGSLERGENEAVIRYSSPTALWVEFGTHPHRPPVEPLIGWARRKLGLSEKEAGSVAWAIASKIAKEGTEAKPFFRPAIAAAGARYNFRGIINFKAGSRSFSGRLSSFSTQRLKSGGRVKTLSR
jgi:hypothetical protein